MDPHGAGGTFEDELVEGEVGLDEGEPVVGDRHVGASVAAKRDGDVGGFTLKVLAVRHAAYGSVEGRGAVTAADGDGPSVVFAEGLQHVVGEAEEVDNGTVAGLIGDLETLRGDGTRELREFEVLGKSHKRYFLKGLKVNLASGPLRG